MAFDVGALAQLSFFAELDEEALRYLVLRMVERTFSSGRTIVFEGDPCQTVHFVAQGVVRTRRLSLGGREQVLAYHGPGESFDLVCAADGGPHLATADALSDTRLYLIPLDHLQRAMSEHPSVGRAILNRLASEVRRLSDMVEGLALHTVRTRLARFLLAQAEGELPSRRWTQEDIAAQIGTVREMVGRTLRALATEGYIRRERGRVVVIDKEGLEREASGA